MFETALPHPSTGLTAIGYRRNGDPIWPVSGGAPTAEEEAAAVAAKAAKDAADAAAAAEDEETEDDEDAELGPAGTKALKAEQDRRRAATAARRTAEKALADALAEVERLKSGTADDAAAQAQREQAAAARKEADTKANRRILNSEVKRLATGKLANPAMALRLLDLDQFEVNDAGDVDETEISEAITDLLDKEPYLKAQGAARVSAADIDAGVKNGPGKGKPVQVTEAQLKTMTPDQIVTAQNEGRLADLLGG